MPPYVFPWLQFFGGFGGTYISRRIIRTHSWRTILCALFEPNCWSPVAISVLAVNGDYPIENFYSNRAARHRLDNLCILCRRELGRRARRAELELLQVSDEWKSLEPCWIPRLQECQSTTSWTTRANYFVDCSGIKDGPGSRVTVFDAKGETDLRSLCDRCLLAVVQQWKRAINVILAGLTGFITIAAGDDQGQCLICRPLPLVAPPTKVEPALSPAEILRRYLRWDKGGC